MIDWQDCNNTLYDVTGELGYTIRVPNVRVNADYRANIILITTKGENHTRARGMRSPCFFLTEPDVEEGGDYETFQ